LLSDTVGFIRKLPTMLIESFKSTLKEIVEADVLIHVVDISHPAFEEQIKVVQETLKELGAADKPTLLVFNKIDAYTNDVQVGQNYLVCPPTLEELKDSYLGSDTKNTVFVSAANNENIEELKEKLIELIAARHFQIYPNYVRPNYYAEAKDFDNEDYGIIEENKEEEE